MAERLLDLAASFSDVLTRTQVLTRRLLELHVFKLVALYTVWVALEEVSAGTLRHPRWPPWSRYRHVAAGRGPVGRAQLCRHCSAATARLPTGVGAELPAGRALGLRPALPPLPAHGLLPSHRVDLCHHRMQDAVPAEGRQPPRVRQQLHRGTAAALARVEGRTQGACPWGLGFPQRTRSPGRDIWVQRCVPTWLTP